MGRYKEPYTLYKRGEYWYFRTYTLNGVRTSGTSTGKRLKSEARAFCEELIKSGHILGSSKTFENFAKGFFDPGSLYFADKLKPPSVNTILTYNNNLNRYLLPYFQNYYLNDIDYLKLKTFRAGLINSGISYNSIKSILGTLKIILNSAYRSGLIVSNPLDKLEPLNSFSTKKDTFTLEEVKTIYNAIEPRFKNEILLMALTGLRISELAGVSPDDIKNSSAGPYIALTKQYNRGELAELKTHNAIRPIPIISDIKPLFSELPITKESEKVLFYMAFKSVRTLLNDYEKRNITAHSLRHFFITSCKSNGIVESKVEFVAGHSIKGVAGVYTNYKIEDLAEFRQWQKKIYDEIIN